ncbi:MAG TPA: hypothetical protein ENI07_04120 [Desulfobacterales bacterium]|nr:hypothetical protein [Desulfobacterales bacterium]
MRGFEASTAGLKAAIYDGWAQINMEAGGHVILSCGKTAVNYWLEHGTDTTVSFQVNPAEPRLRLAIARKSCSDFVIDCISTDGGGIPRNVTVEMGLSLVRLQALSIEDFVIKTSKNPARILGITDKGHLGIGADADITVVDMLTQKPRMSIANGKIIMCQGRIIGTGCYIITTPLGEAAVRNNGLSPIVIDPAITPFLSKNSRP